MGIPLGNNRETLPSFKFEEVGALARYVIIDVDESAPLMNYHDGKQKEYEGKLRTQVGLTVFAIDGCTATVGTGKGDAKERRAVKPGEIVTLYISGHNRFDPDSPEHQTYAVAQKKRGQIEVGDFGGARFERTEPGRGTEPKKIMSYAFRAPNPDVAVEMEWKAAAEAEYAKRHPGIAVGASPSAQSASDAGLI